MVTFETFFGNIVYGLLHIEGLGLSSLLTKQLVTAMKIDIAAINYGKKTLQCD